jgi:phenylalanyl-tRNA synthetase beta chain
VGEVHPAVVREFGLEEGPVAVFELNLANLLQVLPVRQQRYKPVGRYPSAIRDLAVVLDLDVPAGKVREIIGKQPLVSRLSLFDVYVGDGIPTGKRSLAYHIHFQAADRTLGAEEVSRALQAILRSLEREVGAELRS